MPPRTLGRGGGAGRATGGGSGGGYQGWYPRKSSRTAIRHKKGGVRHRQGSVQHQARAAPLGGGGVGDPGRPQIRPPFRPAPDIVKDVQPLP